MPTLETIQKKYNKRMKNGCNKPKLHIFIPPKSDSYSSSHQPVKCSIGTKRKKYREGQACCHVRGL